MELPPVASRLDGALGLELESAEDGVATLRLDPGAVAVVEDEQGDYLHGGALATCIDTAAWYAASSAEPADWIVSSLQLEAQGYHAVLGALQLEPEGLVELRCDHRQFHRPGP